MTTVTSGGAWRAHPAVTKAAFLEAMEGHLAADRLVKGRYWQDGRGCAVGCGIHTLIALSGERFYHGDHGALARLLGIPVELVQLQDRLFEGLTAEDARSWPLAFARAIPDGADLSGVWPAFAGWMLRTIVLPACGGDESIRRSVERVILGLETAWAHDTPEAAAAAAESARAGAVAAADWAAADAAAWAATSAAEAADADGTEAAWAAEAASEAAAESAADAVESAADAAAAAWATVPDAAAAAYRAMRDHLLTLLADADGHSCGTRRIPTVEILGSFGLCPVHRQPAPGDSGPARQSGRKEIQGVGRPLGPHHDPTCSWVAPGVGTREAHARHHARGSGSASLTLAVLSVGDQRIAAPHGRGNEAPSSYRHGRGR